jgi:hypothetical protein
VRSRAVEYRGGREEGERRERRGYNSGCYAWHYVIRYDVICYSAVTVAVIVQIQRQYRMGNKNIVESWRQLRFSVGAACHVIACDTLTNTSTRSTTIRFNYVVASIHFTSHNWA